jgi:malate synthase
VGTSGGQGPAAGTGPPNGPGLASSDGPEGSISGLQGLRVAASTPELTERVLTPGALAFLEDLSRRFDARRRELLAQRGSFRDAIRKGDRPSFRSDTQSIREADWKVPPPPTDLQDRRVEITGPVDRKMVINALNSGAKVYMADFEDSHSPTWIGTLQGQANLFDAVHGTIQFEAPDGRLYRVRERPATLMVRPRGLHLEERHLAVDGRPISASWFDFGLFFYHNARTLIERGSGPYFYLPKLEHYPEAALWNDVFERSEERLGIPSGSIRATVLIETLPAVFEMDEILHALRTRSAGLNCGRWDYIFSFIKQFRDDPRAVFPDRALLPMTTPFLDRYSRLLVRTCHRRGAHAIGGMAAQIPIKNDPARNEAALSKVIADKEREVAVGHDGTWVAHPGLVPIAMQVFDRGMPTPNQIDRPFAADPPIRAEDLLEIPTGPVTAAGVRTNVRVALRYLEAWHRGIGCVPIDHLMEDAATVEIARAQLWQWIVHRRVLNDGPPMTVDHFRRDLGSEATELEGELTRAGLPTGSWAWAREFLDSLVCGPEFADFFTLKAYEALEGPGQGAGT